MSINYNRMLQPALRQQFPQQLPLHQQLMHQLLHQTPIRQQLNRQLLLRQQLKNLHKYVRHRLTIYNPMIYFTLFVVLKKKQKLFYFSFESRFQITCHFKVYNFYLKLIPAAASRFMRLPCQLFLFRHNSKYLKKKFFNNNNTILLNLILKKLLCKNYSFA